MSFESYGEYQLLKKLASGGMATIFLARQQGMEGFEKLMVVKRILPHLAENEDFVKMFLDEARIAARLNHPNIVQIFNLGAQDDTYFIAMEYIHGEDCRRVWKRADMMGKPIPVPLVCRIVMEAAAGLDYAHHRTDAAGKPLAIVHRDVSPQNIIVTFEGTVKVVDFGIAKAVDQATITKSGVLKGKYSYMSPEQAAGGKIDARTDIFALGIVLYELLTGVRLFKRNNDIQTLNAVTECEVPPPSSVSERLPASLDAVVLKALTKTAEARYQTAAELQSALDGWLIANKLPSSSVHLATFMREVYAERLKREAEEGKPLVEEENLNLSLDPPARATPAVERSEPSAPTASLKMKPGPPIEEASEVTRGDDSESADKKAEPAAVAPISSSASTSASVSAAPERVRNTSPTDSMASTAGSVTEADRRPQRFPWGPMVALGVSGLALGAWLVAYVAGGANVRVESDPEQAAVTIDGQVFNDAVTPCTLPRLAPGTHRIALTKRGYVRLESLINVPDRGELRWPAFRLAKEKPPEVAAPSPAPPAEPAGKLDDQTPAPEPSALSLAKKQVGTVRFSVRPAAKIVCGDLELGTTPMKDQQLPAGSYRCTFTNEGLNERRTQVVVVEPNVLTKVSVTLKP